MIGASSAISWKIRRFLFSLISGAGSGVGVNDTPMSSGACSHPPDFGFFGSASGPGYERSLNEYPANAAHRSTLTHWSSSGGGLIPGGRSVNTTQTGRVAGSPAGTSQPW